MAAQSSSDVNISGVDSTPLDLDDLFDVQSELNPIASNWKNVGLALRMKPDILDTIQAENPGNPTACLIATLKEWLNRNYNVKRFGEPTWQRLVEAVSHPAGGANVALATKIAENHKVIVPQISRLAVTQQASPSRLGAKDTQMTVSGHQESSKAAVFARENRQAIMDKFAAFQANVCRKLFMNGVNTEEFRLLVASQFPPGDVIPHSPTNVFKIFEAITYHGLWDYFHFSPLVRIAKRYGENDAEMEGWVKAYKKDMKAYSAVAKLEDYIEADLDVTDPPPAERAKYDPRYYCAVEWKAEFIDHSLQYLTEVWELFSSHYLVPDSPPTALLDRVCKGCFSITWLVPSGLIPQLIKRAKSDTHFFQQHHILRVTVGDERIYEEEDTLDPEQLFQACEQGDLEVVDRFLAANIDVDITDTRNWTPLYIASWKGSDWIVDQLLTRGADVNYQDGFGQSPLWTASLHGHSGVVELLLAAGADSNIQTKDGATALFVASQNNHVNIVQQLLQSGASVDIQKEDGFSPLHIASQEGHVDVCTLLIERGANLNSQTKDGATPLYISCQEGHIQVVEVLIAANADVNRPRENGWSPLMNASQHGHREVAALLIEQGANLNLQNKDQDTALTIASYHGKVEVVKELLAAGAHTDLQADDGRTALALASWNGHLSVVKELVAKGANPNIQDPEGLTALLLAIKQGHTEIVWELVHHGNVDVNIQEESTGWTALFFAAKDGDLDLIRLFIHGGANVELKDKNGVTALDVARTFSYDSVCQELQSHMSRQHEQQKTTTETKELVKAARMFLQTMFSRVERSILKTRSIKREMTGNKSHSAHEGHKTISHQTNNLVLK